MSRLCLNCGAAHVDPSIVRCTACDGPVAATNSSDPLVGRRLNERYTLKKLLGQGGFGSVYRATHDALDRTVAIKLLRLDAQGNPDALKRFYAEAKNSSQLSHAHNVRVFDFGHTVDGLTYLVMELVAGEQLSDLKLPISTSRALSIADQVAAAVHEAHEFGLVHRDLKADNIMVTRVDNRDFVHVLDYGISKLEDSSRGLTKTGAVIGTPAYMAPEQFETGEFDRRVDVYALGVILYELIVGERPFVATDPLSVLLMHRTVEPTPPSARVGTPAFIDALVLGCLAKNPAERFSSMLDVRDEIERIRTTRGLESYEGTEEAMLPGRDRTRTLLTPDPNVRPEADSASAAGAALQGVPQSAAVSAAHVRGHLTGSPQSASGNVDVSDMTATAGPPRQGVAVFAAVFSVTIAIGLAAFFAVSSGRSNDELVEGVESSVDADSDSGATPAVPTELSGVPASATGTESSDNTSHFAEAVGVIDDRPPQLSGEHASSAAAQLATGSIARSRAIAEEAVGNAGRTSPVSSESVGNRGSQRRSRGADGERAEDENLRLPQSGEPEAVVARTPTEADPIDDEPNSHPDQSDALRRSLGERLGRTDEELTAEQRRALIRDQLRRSEERAVGGSDAR